MGRPGERATADQGTQSVPELRCLRRLVRPCPPVRFRLIGTQRRPVSFSAAPSYLDARFGRQTACEAIRRSSGVRGSDLRPTGMPSVNAPAHTAATPAAHTAGRTRNVRRANREDSGSPATVSTGSDCVVANSSSPGLGQPPKPVRTTTTENDHQRIRSRQLRETLRRALRGTLRGTLR